MGVDPSRKHVEFDDPVAVDRHDSGDPRVGAVVADDGVIADRRHEAGTDIDRRGHQAPVVGHVHKVDADVALIRPRRCFLHSPTLPLG